MKGNGTKESPYEVTTVDELYEAITDDGGNSTFSTEKCVKLMNDLDFNEYEYWNLKPTTIYFTEFDGQGHVIKNIYIKDLDYLFKYTNRNIGVSVVMKNTIFEVIKMEIMKKGNFIDFSAAYSTTYKYYIINCEFRAKIFNYLNNGNPLLNLQYYWNMLNCTLNIDFYDNGYSYAQKQSNETCMIIGFKCSTSVINTIENCEININMHMYKGGGTTTVYKTLFNSSYSTTMINNAIFINLYLQKDISLSKICMANYIKLTNNSVVVTNKTPDYKFINDTTDSSYSLEIANNPSTNLLGGNIFDKDTCKNIVYNSTNLNLLTTEQMKDKDYLISLGFPII